MIEGSYPPDLLYHPEHDWARIDAEDPAHATLGITWYAQDALGEVVFFEAPAVGTKIAQDQPYAEVESVKAVSELYAPVSGEVVEVNLALKEKPEMVNRDPHASWMIVLRLTSPGETAALVDAAQYTELVK